MGAVSRKARESREGKRLALALQPTARELFPYLVGKLQDSRPVVGTKHVVPEGAKPNRKGVLPTVPVPVLGAPTFRNRIVEGRHV